MTELSDLTDVFHITVAGINPHILVDGRFVGGIVEVWTSGELTPEQASYLAALPFVIDVRHVYPA
jgi:hypothetical protein